MALKSASARVEFAQRTCKRADKSTADGAEIQLALLWTIEGARASSIGFVTATAVEHRVRSIGAARGSLSSFGKKPSTSAVTQWCAHPFTHGGMGVSEGVSLTAIRETPPLRNLVRSEGYTLRYPHTPHPERTPFGQSSKDDERSSRCFQSPAIAMGCARCVRHDAIAVMDLPLDHSQP